MRSSFHKLRGLTSWVGMIERLSHPTPDLDIKVPALSKRYFKEFCASCTIATLQEVDPTFTKISSAVNNRIIERHEDFLNGVTSLFSFLTHSTVTLHGADAFLIGTPLCPDEIVRLGELIKIHPYRIKPSENKDQFLLQIRSES